MFCSENYMEACFLQLGEDNKQGGGGRDEEGQGEATRPFAEFFPTNHEARASPGQNPGMGSACRGGKRLKMGEEEGTCCVLRAARPGRWDVCHELSRGPGEMLLVLV